MHLDLTISIHVDTFGRTTGLPTLVAGLSTRAFNLVSMASPAPGEWLSVRTRPVGGIIRGVTYAIDFFFCRLRTPSLGILIEADLVSPIVVLECTVYKDWRKLSVKLCGDSTRRRLWWLSRQSLIVPSGNSRFRLLGVTSYGLVLLYLNYTPI
jgi:hypothetical protein